jgi:oxygen-dependent protoporphyrinogen oxidase
MAGNGASVRHVAVVGGGITGLSAAHHMSDAVRAGGLRVTVLEASPRLGGKVRTDRPGDLVIEEGPDSFLTRKPWARELCEALGLGSEFAATPPDRQRSFIYHRGRLAPVPPGVATGVPSRLGPLLWTPLLSPGAKIRALVDLTRPRLLTRDGPDVSLGAFLRARLGPEVVDRLAEPLLSGIYAGGADELSLDATFPLLREQEVEYGSLIRAAMAQARARRRNAASAATASPPPPMFLTLRGGLERLIEALAAALAAAGVTVRTAAPVRALERAGRGGYTLRLPGEELNADAVVIAAPAHDAASILNDAAPDAARELGAIAYADVALVVLGYDRADVPHPLNGSGFVVPRGEDIDITACTWVSEKWPHSAPADTALLRVYLGRAGGAVLDRADDDLVDAARRALTRALGVRAEPRLVKVVRTPRALPQYAVGHLARVERIERALAGLPGVMAAGAHLRGVGLPDCVRQGRDAADAALRHVAPAAR